VSQLPKQESERRNVLVFFEVIEPNGILKAKPGAEPPYCSEAEISKKSKLKTLNEKKKVVGQ
jgi:hypothetical protein